MFLLYWFYDIFVFIHKDKTALWINSCLSWVALRRAPVLWTHEIEHVSNKLRTGLAQLYRLRGTNAKIILNVYEPLVESIVRYVLTVYEMNSNNKNEIASKLIQRIVSNIWYGTPYHHLDTKQEMKIFNALPVDSLIKYVILTKHYYNCQFKIRQVKPRKLRYPDIFKIPKLYDYGKIIRQYYVPVLFSILPKDLLQLTRLKNKMKHPKQFVQS